MIEKRVASSRDLPRLGGLVAFSLRQGDTVILSGEPGSGRTAFAEAVIKAAMGDDEGWQPRWESSNQSIARPGDAAGPRVRTYETPRLRIAHVELSLTDVRGGSVREDFAEVPSVEVLIVECRARPRALGSVAGIDRLEVHFAMGGHADTRLLETTGCGNWQGRMERLAVLDELLSVGWRDSRVAYLQGDASPRRYARVRDGGRTALLMDAPRQPDGPPIRDGLPYSRIAHLAEDVRAFVGVQKLLKERGLAAPEIYLADIVRGALLIEDLGDRVYGNEIAAGADMATLWRPAVEVLLRLRGVRPEAPVELWHDADDPEDSPSHTIPPYDKRALGIETELLLDWYWPLARGEQAPQVAREEFLALWSPILDRVIAAPQCLTLRDYHSPNLIALSGRGEDVASKVGIIDFQDAVIGHSAYDLVSLLQDARLDVPAAIETKLLAHYCVLARNAEPDFDEAEFRFAYAALGAQRNTKILGIFARLFKRDGKPQYLQHIPRIWGYLARDLDHPELSALKGWYDCHLPAVIRSRRLGA